MDVIFWIFFGPVIVWLSWAAFPLSLVYRWRNSGTCTNTIDGAFLALRWPLDLYEFVQRRLASDTTPRSM